LFTDVRFLDFDGKTRILAISLTKHQDESSFAWVFEKFRNLFGIPKLIFTDQDAAMKVALFKTLKETTHLLCVFHIWKNFYTNVMPLLRNSSGCERAAVANDFWRLAKDSDESMAVEFDTQFDIMSEKIASLSKDAGVSEVSLFI